LPFAAVIIYYGIPYVIESFTSGEKSALALGAPARWIMKSAMPFGIGLFIVAAIVAALRNLTQRQKKFDDRE
jgi:TRAP-type mannitol/chloroaromatic compound transport system permease small subunit